MFTAFISWGREYMVIKVRLNKNKDWDKRIAEWIGTIPQGYRSIKIKEILYQTIQGQTPALGSTDTGKDKKRCQIQDIDNDISKKISKLIK